MKLALTNIKFARVICWFFIVFVPGQAGAVSDEIVAIDSEGRRVVLSQPAQRIISLSPHITELLFAAGAGNRVIGAVEYSDYPAPAKDVKRIGSAFKVDMESLLSLQPDLVVAWTSGNSASDIAMIKRFGIPLFFSDPKHLQDIPHQIRNLAQLVNTQHIAETAAGKFTVKYQDLKTRFGGKQKVSVFYQLWHQPIMTVNKNHLINDVIELCGGRNVFSHLPSLTPVVGVETVMAANPEFIISSSVAPSESNSMWAKWTGITAVRENRIIDVPADLLHRQGPRIIDAAEIMCRELAATRT